ncbi:unnamed protein product, partial [Phaeothamnion confervicola]
PLPESVEKELVRRLAREAERAGLRPGGAGPEFHWYGDPFDAPDAVQNVAAGGGAALGYAEAQPSDGRGQGGIGGGGAGCSGGGGGLNDFGSSAENRSSGKARSPSRTGSLNPGQGQLPPLPLSLGPSSALAAFSSERAISISNAVAAALNPDLPDSPQTAPSLASSGSVSIHGHSAGG